MHVCTHICIITYTCFCGFPAKLLPCVVHYPRALSRKAETRLWGQGIFTPISPGPEIQKATLRRGSCVQGELRHGPSPTKQMRVFWGEQVRTMAPCLLLNFLCQVLGCLHPFKTPEVAQRMRDAVPVQPCCSASGNTCLGDAELRTSEQKYSLSFQFHTRLGCFFLAPLSISVEKLFCV